MFQTLLSWRWFTLSRNVRYNWFRELTIKKILLCWSSSFWCWSLLHTQDFLPTSLWLKSIYIMRYDATDKPGRNCYRFMKIKGITNHHSYALPRYWLTLFHTMFLLFILLLPLHPAATSHTSELTYSKTQSYSGYSQLQHQLFPTFSVLCSLFWLLFTSNFSNLSKVKLR